MQSGMKTTLYGLAPSLGEKKKGHFQGLYYLIDSFWIRYTLAYIFKPQPDIKINTINNFIVEP